MTQAMTPQAALTQACARLQPVNVPDEYAVRVAHWVIVLAEHIAFIEAVALDDRAEPADIFRA